ncbi:MAG: hypothetical protein LBB85_13005, partial [Dysgonamonadaceae bacterium]|nr:hypothetical protein [Dysgonamonadaceae bacterium]
MKTIVKMQLKWMQSKYGVYLYFIPLYQLGKNIFYFSGFFAGSVMAWQFVEQGYLTQSVYEQLVFIACFLGILLFKKERQYALVPYITKLTVSKIRNYIVVRELFSASNFIFFPFVASVLMLSHTIENSTLSYVYLFIVLWLTGVGLNLSTRIIKYFCIKYKLCFITTLSIALAYSVILALFYRTATVFSYSNFIDSDYYIPVLLSGIALLIPGYFYVIKQELYQVYDGNHWSRETVRNFHSKPVVSNVFSQILLLKYLRCKSFKKFLVQMLIYAMAGILFFIVFDLKIIGLGMLLGIYAFNMLPFTIYLSSNYFDGLYAKPVSIKSLLLSAFYIHIIITTILFLILLIFVTMYDKSLLLTLIALYFYTSGPVAALLLSNILFAQP